MRFQVVTVASVKITAFWDIALRNLKVDWRFRYSTNSYISSWFFVSDLFIALMIEAVHTSRCQSTSTRLHDAVSHEAVIFSWNHYTHCSYQRWMSFTPTHLPLRHLYKGFLIPPMVFTLKIVGALMPKFWKPTLYVAYPKNVKLYNWKGSSSAFKVSVRESQILVT
jgi:hypothetical protein